MRILRDWTFSWREMGLLKLSLISLGIILGIYFFQYLSGLLWLFWIIFIIGAAYFLIRFAQAK